MEPALAALHGLHPDGRDDEPDRDATHRKHHQQRQRLGKEEEKVEQVSAGR